MKHRYFVCALVAGAAAMSLPAFAGPLDSLKAAVPGLAPSTHPEPALPGGSLLDSLGGGGFSLGSAQNAAGILGYCQAHGYAPSATETVKNKLMSKLGIQNQASQSDDYKQGLAGMLQDAKGGTLDLSKVKGAIGKRACSMVADQAASSLLGG